MNLLQNKEIQFERLGLIDYKEAWDYQDKLFNAILELKAQNRTAEAESQAITPNYLLFCSHPHVYTLGKSGHESNLLINEAGLQAKGATFYKINRGGDITYHGPGQIVGYPILDLDNFFTDIHKYLRFLEEAIILTLKDYGLEAGRIPGLTGVWLDYVEQNNPRKICAMGVKCSRWVTMHGFAFNINTDLDYFNNIVPCGISDKQVTSLAKELGREVPLPEVEEKLLTHLAHLFEAKIITAAHEERH
ncbi:lipoyl(octanoyl) transferase LipB [Pontibacter sp. SGAir0037]|uniref:lipoyl(octanoyl) transferase LipB n=1 Tax=Pontibacter sp. SGAir0037 TaxID=2571030 RepID=UPI0010CCBE8C|nr:lipoyl(octanoyl) transferase LipB [Pontibacter sp. SGAir0037]QCR25162.1 lipoyl(octanoyl) transferase [Pontibacter sp. SGAir0037]